MSSTFDLNKLLEISKIDPALQQEIEQFYYREALLLDNSGFEEWSKLLGEDLRYFMPIRRNVLFSSRSKADAVSRISADDEFAHFDDDIVAMRGRIRKLLSDYSWSENPASRTRHIVSNVIINEGNETGSYQVCSNFLLYRNRLEHQVDMWAGQRQDIIKRSDNRLGFEISKRTILLDQSTLISNNLSVIF